MVISMLIHSLCLLRMFFDLGRHSLAARRVGSVGSVCRRVVAAVFVEIHVVVSAYVTRQLRPLHFQMVRLNHGRLNDFAAGRIDGVCNVGMELGPAIGAVPERAVFVQLQAAVAAKTAAQVVFRAASGAAVRQFAAGHGHEAALGAIDDLEVADDKHVVECYRAEGVQPFVVVLFFDQLDANFGDLHGGSP